jgi:non-specific serine/threonine protein kinase/serine/threonine-protein kinase
MIVLMALRKEPERRYKSAALLAEDVRRHLDGRPVLARSDSTGYRVGKFVRRHAAAVVAVAVAMLALLAAVAGTSTGLVLARRERDRALGSAREARAAVDQFFTRVSEERLLNQPGLRAIRKELLQDAQQFYEGFVAKRGGDPELRAELAVAQSRLARVTAEFGSPVEAAEQLLQAVALWEGLLRSDPGNPDYQEELARALNDRAGVLLRQAGHRDLALGDCRRAQALLEPLAAAPGAPALARYRLGLVLQNIVKIQFEQGHSLEAIQTLDRALHVLGQLAGEDPRWLDPRIALARGRHEMALILSDQSNGVPPAIVSCQQGIDILESINRDHPELADQAYALAMDSGDLGTLQQMAGQLDSALASIRRAIVVLERLDRQYPGVVSYQRGLASTYNMMSDLHRRRLEPAESLDVAEKARALLERLVAEHQKEFEARADLAKSYNNIARAQQIFREPGAALRSFQRAIDLYEGLPELDPRNSYNLACDLALCIPLIGAKEGSNGEVDPEAVSQRDRLRRRLYGDRAIEVLGRAIRGGFLNAEILGSDPDLTAIRGRDDFQRVVQQVEKPAPAVAK